MPRPSKRQLQARKANQFSVNVVLAIDMIEQICDISTISVALARLPRPFPYIS
ncbi:13644_t:CDS:2 [Gigaspora margarita]|uniref:13644_t:CDS:1 n=1 Tax=Gigaspora margarita TaxID=4874 RepID=A0ABN7WH43_GIGMA|nr:13644_t:CDS:2 [Gigaspora margarita]